MTLTEPPPVRALTLRNPWPLAITQHGKRIECRSRTFPGGSTDVMLHAGKGWDPAGLVALAELGVPADQARAESTPSAIVAVATVTGVCVTAAVGGACGCGRWAMPGLYHWQLDKVKVLTTPVPCRRGFLGLWKPPAAVAAAVADMLALGVARLRCGGRSYDRDGRPNSPPCGETPKLRQWNNQADYEVQARAAGWRIETGRLADPTRGVMCPHCARPDRTIPAILKGTLP